MLYTVTTGVSDGRPSELFLCYVNKIAAATLLPLTLIPGSEEPKNNDVELVNGVHRLTQDIEQIFSFWKPLSKAVYNISVPAASVFSKQLDQKWKEKEP